MATFSHDALDSEGRGSPAPLALRESRYDRVTSLLIALIVVFGGVAAWLVVLWVTNQVWVPRAAVAVELVEVPGGDLGEFTGETLKAGDPQQPRLNEASDADQPEEEAQLEQALTSILDVLAEMPMDVVEPQAQDDAARTGPRGHAAGTGWRGGGPSGLGVPREQRWQVLYDPGQTLEEYARQLDHFKVELGTIVGNRLLYLSGLSQPKPSQRTGSSVGELRLYLLWRRGELRRADVELFRKAGIEVGSGIVMQFYPAEVEQQLAALEQQFAGRRPEEIRRTSFGVRKAGSGYQFYVIEQDQLAGK